MRSVELHVGFYGELDGSTVADFRGRLGHWLAVARNANIKTLIADFDEVTFLDSNAVRTLIITFQESQDAGIIFKVGKPQPLVCRVFEIAKLMRLVEGEEHATDI